MPNHLFTKLEVQGNNKSILEMIEYVKGKEDAFSCNKVIPMPKVLMGVQIPIEIISEEEYEKYQDKYGLGKPLTQKLHEKYVKKYGFSNWYDWACKKWGTKWDVYDVTKWKKTDKKASIHWVSAWSPVIPVVLKVSKKYPTLKFSMKYADEGGYLSHLTIEKGKIITDKEIDWDSLEGTRLKKEVKYS